MTIITSMIYLIFIILFKSSVASSFLCFGLLDASLMIHPFCIQDVSIAIR